MCARAQNTTVTKCVRALKTRQYPNVCVRAQNTAVTKCVCALKNTTVCCVQKYRSESSNKLTITPRSATILRKARNFPLPDIDPLRCSQNPPCFVCLVNKIMYCILICIIYHLVPLTRVCLVV